MERDEEMQARKALYLSVGLGLALLVGIYYVYPIRQVVLILFLTVLFAVILGAPVDYLARRGVGRGWGVIAVAVSFLVFVQVLVEFAAGPISAQAQQLFRDLPALLLEAQGVAERLPGGLGNNLGRFLDPNRVIGALQEAGLSVSTVLNVGSGAAEVLSSAIVVLLGGAFAVLRPAPLVEGFVNLFPAGRRQRVREILWEMYHTVQRWLLGQLADMAILGVLSATALWLLGVPFALLLGLISGLLGFVPYVGFAISLVPPVLLALADEPIKALWVVLAYVVVQQVEGNLIYPFVMSRAVSLHPAAVVFGIFVAGLLFGVAGLILAVPLVAALHVLVDELWVTRMDGVGVDPNPPPEEAKAIPRRTGPFKRLLKALPRPGSK
jgi:predicted PurR-regulated permease PerM